MKERNYFNKVRKIRKQPYYYESQAVTGEAWAGTIDQFKIVMENWLKERVFFPVEEFLLAMLVVKSLFQRMFFLDCVSIYIVFVF